MDVAAENATELPRLGKPRIKLNVQANHTDEESRQFPDSDYPSSRRRKERTGTNRGAPPLVDLMQELGPRDRAVSAKGVHHA